MPPMGVSGSQTFQGFARLSSADKRQRWVALAILLQAFWALALIALAGYLLVLATSRPPDHATGLRLSAAIIAMPGLIAATGGLGLWRSKGWGWWLSLICDWGIVAALIYAIIDDAIDGLLDWSLVGTTLFAIIVPILLMSPAVGRFYLRTRSRLPSLSS